MKITSELLNDLPADLSGVSLVDNQIERLEKGFIFNKNLCRLNLENNFISYIADGAWQGSKLSTFFLSVNQLREHASVHISPRSFVNLNDLEILNVAQNNVTAIRTRSLRGLSSTTHLRGKQPENNQTWFVRRSQSPDVPEPPPKQLDELRNRNI